MLDIDIRYSEEERQLLRKAIEAANQVLEKEWGGSGRRFEVGYIELNASHYDQTLEAMVPEMHFLVAARR